MKTLINILIVAIYLQSNINLCRSQPQFQSCIGGTNDDRALSVTQTFDGGFLVAGGTYSYGAGSEDMYVVRLDANNIVKWSKTIGGTGIDYATSVLQTNDGGYIISGNTFSFGAGNSDFYIVKLDSNGNMVWNKTVGRSFSDNLFSVAQSSDDGYFIFGHTQHVLTGPRDLLVVKLNNNGDLAWAKAFGGGDTDFGFSFQKTSDGGLIIAGASVSFGQGNYDYYIVKLDNTGAIQWSRTIGGTNNDRVQAIIQSYDGGYVAAGFTNSFGAGGSDFYVIKFDVNGSLLWTRTIGGTNNDWANSIIQTADSSLIIAGYTSSFGAGSTDCAIVKLSSNGTHLWTKTIGGSGNEEFQSIIKTIDNNYMIVGFANSFGAGNNDIFMVRLDSSGSTCGNINSHSPSIGTGGTVGNPTSIITNVTPMVSAPIASINTGGILTTVCSIVGIQNGYGEIPVSFHLSQNYPNPFNPVTKINYQIPNSSYVKLDIYDITGREIMTLVNKYMPTGFYTETFDGRNFSSGMYFYRLQAGDFVQIKKMILVK